MTTTRPKAKALNAPDWLAKALSGDRVKRVTVPMREQPQWIDYDEISHQWLGHCGDLDASIEEIKPPHPPGTLIYFREAFRVSIAYDNKPAAEAKASVIHYEADGRPTPMGYGFRWGKVRASEAMPQDRCRHWRLVSDCRPVRLGELTWEDALSEGVPAEWCCDGLDCNCRGLPIDNPVEDRKHLWNAQHGHRHPWDERLWAWDIRLEHTQDTPAAGETT